MDPTGGKGSFSLMFTASDIITNNKAVLKFYDPNQYGDMDRQMRFCREGEVLMRLKGLPNILQCLDNVCNISICLTGASGLTFPVTLMFIPMEMASGNIDGYIYSDDKKPEKCLIYFREICKAVARIQAMHICHRDLKPGNFLVFSKDEVRLGDFGTAKFLDGSMPNIRANYTSPVGDLFYCAPELFWQIGIGDDQAYCSDMFSLGAILFEMFTGTVLTQYIYTKDFLVNMLNLRTVFAGLPEDKRKALYFESADVLSGSVNLPDIFSFNDFVPNSIKHELNWLYKSLSRINFTKRLHDFQIIYRRINICLLVLRNEKARKYFRMKKRD
jgi:serine/threonine protein kinase